MKILKMAAAFGCLDGEELTLTEGLNVIRRPNERGKTTWCAFIMAMLYGVDSGERARAGRLPDKTRYAPWSGAPMAGRMELESAGRAITLTRTTRLKSAPMREFLATYTDSGEPVPDLDGQNAGEALTGVSREVLRRSAFIGQGAVAVTGTPELEKRIAALVSSGEEDTSYAEADALLREWQRRRSYNRRGAIPELTAQISDQEQALYNIREAGRKRDDAAQALQRIRDEKAGAEKRLADEKDRARQNARDTLDAARAGTAEARGRADKAVRGSAEAQAALRSGPFGDADPDEITQKAEADAARAERLLAIVQKQSSLLPAALLAALCVLFAVLGVLAAWPFYLGAAVAAAGASVLFSLRAAKKRNAAACARSRQEILAAYNAQDEAGLRAAAASHLTRWKACASAQRAENAAREALAAAERRETEAQHRFLSPDPDETAAADRALRTLAERERTLSAQLAEMTGAAAALGDPMAVESGLLRARAHKAELEAQYDALELAVTALREADAEIRGRFSPALTRAAARYLAQLTGGRYDALELERDFSARTRLAGDVAARDAAYLSAGASDLLYLAVRLAVCELVLPAEDPCPLVLDDALVNLDPEREALAMDLLRGIARERQVILFTCR